MNPKKELSRALGNKTAYPWKEIWPTIFETCTYMKKRKAKLVHQEGNAKKKTDPFSARQGSSEMSTIFLVSTAGVSDRL